MKDSKLVEIVKSFSADEMKSFEKFINSPYFSTGRDVSGLFGILKKHYPAFDSPKLEKEIVFRKVFPKEPYSEKKLKNILYDLTKLAEQFLTHESVKQDNNKATKQLALQYKNRNKDKLLLRTLQVLENKTAEKLFDSEECFKDKEEIEGMKTGFYIEKNEYDKSLLHRIKYTEYFTISFLIRFLRKFRDKVIITTKYNMPFDSPLIDTVFENIDFDKILETLDEKKYPEYWLLAIYYYALKSISNLEDESYYHKFKQLVYRNIDKFSRLEKYYLFSDFVAYCIEKDVPGALAYKTEEFGIHKKMLEENAYSSSEDEYMGVVLFRNIMLVSLSIKEYGWLEGFVGKYTEKLKPEFRDNMQNLAMANIYFARKDFDAALDSIGKVKYDFFLYKLDTKTLMLKIYYELDLFDQAYYLMDAYRHFLDGNRELSDSIRLQQYNFVNVYSKILKAKSSGNIGEADITVTEILKLHSVSSRNWLVEKAKELVKGNKK